MEAGEENGNNMGLKRQRAPLSDSEDNNCSAPETNDSQKRRRLEAAGQENHCPEASSSGRRAELETKPDTPIVPSVRSRVQQLTQRRDGGAPPAQRCLSDPGGDSKGHKEPLLGEAEFNQRMERFKMASFQSSPTNTPSPANQYPRTRSSFVSVIQQKLQGSTTPSSKQVTRIRQEREHELSQVPFQPIAENAWLKRSSSDSALAEDQGLADVKDGSFTEPPTTNAESASLNMTGEMTSGHSEAPAAYSETGMQKRCVLSEEPRQMQEALSANEEEQPGPQQPEGQTVLKLSFSEDHSFFKAPSDTEVSFREETNTGEIIDQMFEEVLEYAERMEGPEDHDSGIGACSVENDKMETETEKSEEEGEAKEEKSDESDKVDGIRDELLNFPPTGILSPLSKSVEAVVTPLRLAASQEPIPPLLLTPEETSAHPDESAPLYSIDAYRTQRQSKLPIVQSVTPGVQRRAEETPKPQPPVNIKEKITALNEEAGKLQTVINQTLQALNCCTDEEHGRGSLEEAEAEKLLLVSCEKRSALLAEVARLKEERSSESGEAAVEDSESISQQPCRGTVSITNIQLPLKVEYVCSSHNRAGRPSHYFFVLIRYGPCNIVATPLATAADAQNGDTISFPTSVTMKDIRSSFEIDVEVYSLSQTSASNCTMERASTKPRVTPRKLLNTLTRSSISSTSAAPPLITRRSSNFCLVGSHKIALASLGHSKFPLDKVPFLSPLEGNIYLQLESKSHSDVQHQGFLTMFELISGYGVWHRRFFVLEECNLYYWNYPNDRETKEAEGSISLSSSQSQCVRPVKRELCARPFTFELVSSVSQQEQDLSQDAAAKCWFSADTKQERLDWMEKLNQALLDFHTWNRTQTESQQANTSSSGNLRESIL
uniref:Anillin, actin binding protein 2 n=1 Tax=Haplochromis burtoni TaxID=8153 RepID=A0A3Q3D0H8_HAPBU